MEFHKFIEQAGLEKKTYQQEGVDWCVEREGSEDYCKGGIIADEMGLGKTIMMIGTLIQNFKMPNLIILPLVILDQWKVHFKQTTGHTPLVYYGAVKKAVTYNMLQNIPIVLTTYGTMISDNKTDKKLQAVKWSRIIFDEAHHMRNKNTHCYKSAISLKSDMKWLITGTPIQNHINDLYSLFDILGISNKVYTKTDNLRLLMNTIVLKRTKKEVGITLPEVHTTRVCTVWKNDNEQKFTETVHNNIGLDKKMLLAMMMYERMMCVYPKLLDGANMKTIRAMGIGKDFENGTKHHSKMDSVIDRIVERKYNGNRKIIFTNFKGEIDFIKNKLTEQGMVVEYIDGRITTSQRKLVLNNVLDVLILQIKTGNEGLNLQQYNEVYFVTPDWNPQTEKQAIARCHRIGQKKEVHVFRFVMDSFDKDNKTTNIEMYSEKVQEKKREIEKSICDNE
jgi:SNF2 family DNA or RNA helicase